MGFFKDLGNDFKSLGHSVGKGFSTVFSGFEKTEKSLLGGVGGIMKTLSNPIVIICIGAAAFFILSKR